MFRCIESAKSTISVYCLWICEVERNLEKIWSLSSEKMFEFIWIATRRNGTNVKIDIHFKCERQGILRFEYKFNCRQCRFSVMRNNS